MEKLLEIILKMYIMYSTILQMNFFAEGTLHMATKLLNKKIVLCWLRDD